MLNQKLKQQQLQKLSPQQIQLMKMLQIPTSLIDQRIEEELEINPALDEASEKEEDDLFEQASESDDNTADGEEFEDPTLESYLDEFKEDDPSSYIQTINSSKDDEYTAPIVKVENTFYEQLQRQMDMREWPNPQERIIVEQILGSIDDDGYLRRELDSIADDLLFNQNIEVQVAQVESALEQVQSFDPPGIGARDLQESLKLQLERKLELEDFQDEEQEKHIEQALTIVDKYFNYFSRKNYNRLMQVMGLNEEELKPSLDEISRLNPKPVTGIQSISDDNYYIIPDFIVENKDGELSLSLNNRNSPEISLNQNYIRMLSTYKDKSRNKKMTKADKDTVTFIKQKLDSAKWFIDALEQRRETLYNTMYVIMQLQKDYFLTGDMLKIKPMILKDVADITGLDVSTISRVSNNKYVQTEFGTKKLKEFFSEASNTIDGRTISTLEVKNALKQIIDSEDKSKPYSDLALKSEMEKKGYQIARRTISKYREQLQIPTAKLRREI